MATKPRLKLRANGTTVNLTMTARHGLIYGNCLLSDEQVIEVKARYMQRGASVRKLASEFGVCKTVIHNIIKGNTYGVVDGAA